MSLSVWVCFGMVSAVPLNALFLWCHGCVNITRRSLALQARTAFSMRTNTVQILIWKTWHIFLLILDRIKTQPEWQKTGTSSPITQKYFFQCSHKFFSSSMKQQNSKICPLTTAGFLDGQEVWRTVLVWEKNIVNLPPSLLELWIPQGCDSFPHSSFALWAGPLSIHLWT